MDKISEIRTMNDTFIEMVKAGETKEAAVSATQFTRNKLREESFAEKILTPIDIANDELNKAEDPELLVKWCDREPDQAPAVTVPLGMAPDGYLYKGTRYPVYFNRIMSPKFSQDIDRLRGYDYDIRGIMMENAVKDIATEIDTKFINKVNEAVGAKNTANPWVSGSLQVPQWVEIPGGITRQNVADAFKVMLKMRVPFGPMQGNTDGSQGCMLMNNVTAMDFLKLERSEAGGDLSERMYLEGKPAQTIFGVKSVFTIKRDLVPDGTIYLFSSEEFFGKYLRLQNMTTFLKSEAYFLQWFIYLNIGMSLGNVRGCARVDFI
jgi:hypothetical protein